MYFYKHFIVELLTLFVINLGVGFLWIWLCVGSFFMLY